MRKTRDICVKSGVMASSQREMAGKSLPIRHLAVTGRHLSRSIDG
jgi:hypothetical protein